MSKNELAGEDILFHEMYNVYYRIVSRLIDSADKAPLTKENIIKTIVRKYGFGMTWKEFENKLDRGGFPVFCVSGDGVYSTPLKVAPRPLSMLERRWLAAVMADERIGLFLDGAELDELKDSLSGIEPLYNKEDFETVDGVNDPDPFTDPVYINNFRALLQALISEKYLRIMYKPRHDKKRAMFVIPFSLQYSLKDEKFRLHGLSGVESGKTWRVTLNLSRIISVSVLEKSISPLKAEWRPETREAVLELSPERGTQERAMIHFANYECASYVGAGGEICMNVKYDAGDEKEVLIRVLSFGPLIHVRSPDSLVSLIKERLRRQRELMSLDALR